MSLLFPNAAPTAANTPARARQAVRCAAVGALALTLSGLACLSALGGCGHAEPAAHAPGLQVPLQTAELQWTLPESVPVQVTKSVQSGPGPITEQYRQGAKQQIAYMWHEAQPATRQRLLAAHVGRGKEAVIHIQPLRWLHNGMGPGGEFRITVYQGVQPARVSLWEGQVEVHAAAGDPAMGMGMPNKLADAIVAALQQAGLVLPPTAAGPAPKPSTGTAAPADLEASP